MTSKRWRFAALVLLIIGLGILSRKLNCVPLFVGDLLYAMMVFYLIRLVFIDASAEKIALFGLLICFTIEISQLYQASWINDIRQTLPGRYILGQGFLWSDLAAYAAGIGMVYLCETKPSCSKSKSDLL